MHLFFQSGILHAELLLVEVGVVGDGRAAARGADDVAERLPDGDVLAPDLVVLGPQRAVVGALVLRLRCSSSSRRTNQNSQHSHALENEYRKKRKAIKGNNVLLL